MTSDVFYNITVFRFSVIISLTVFSPPIMDNSHSLNVEIEQTCNPG